MFINSSSRFLYVLSICICIIIADFCGAAKVERVTPSGTYIGFKGSFGVDTFLGIRYGEAMIGENRFKDSTAPPSIQESRHEVTTLPPSCPQSIDNTFGKDFKGTGIWNPNTEMNEDCLFLNVWQSIKLDDAPLTKKPVLVWIYGGSFNSGSSTLDLYNATYLTGRMDIVFVSFQYRLGALGFLYTGDDVAPGNMGLKDQILALKWVYRNIEYFGGDKNRIVLVGESAGSGSVGYHLLSPDTSKMIHSAILLSGTPNSEWAFVSPSEAKQRANALISSLKGDPNDPVLARAVLKGRKWQEIVEKELRITNPGPVQTPFSPVMGVNIIPENPIEMMKKARHLKGKHFMISWTKDEGSYFLAYFFKEELIKYDSPLVFNETYMGSLRKMAGHNEILMQNLSSLYNVEGASYVQRLSNYIGDRYFKCPINQFIDHLRKHKAVVYQFEFNHRNAENPWPKWMGVMHGYELDIFFGLPAYSASSRYTTKDRDLMKTFLLSVEEFIKTDNPNTDENSAWSNTSPFSVTADKVPPVDLRTQFCKGLAEAIPNYLESKAASFHKTYLIGISVASLFFFFRIIS